MNSLVEISWLITSDISAVSKRVLVDLVYLISKDLDDTYKAAILTPYLIVCLSQLNADFSQSIIGESALRGKMARLIMSSIETSGDVVIDKTAMFVRLMNDPDYEVQIQVPTFISLKTEFVKLSIIDFVFRFAHVLNHERFLFRSFFDINQLQSVMMRMVFVPNTVNEVLYMCCRAIVALDSNLPYPLQMNNNELLDASSVLERVSDRLMSTKNTYLVEAMLPLFASLLTQVCNFFYCSLRVIMPVLTIWEDL